MSKKEKANGRDKIGMGKFMAWQSRSISGAINVLLLGFITIYCTDTMEMSAALVGTMLMLSKIADGVVDLFYGYIIDRTNTKIGRGRPYELAIIGTWICTWLLFSMPKDASMLIKCIWLFVTYVLIQAVFNSLLAASTTVYMVRAFSSDKQYVSLSSFGGIIVTIFAVVFNVSFPILMNALATSAAGWSKLVAIISIPMAIIGIMRFIFIKEENDVDVASEAKVNFKEVVSVLKNNKYIYIIALMMFISNFISNMGVSIYYYKYIVGNVALMSITSALSVLALFTMIFYPSLIKKIGVARMLKLGCIMFMLGSFLMFFAGKNVAFIAVCSIIMGIGSLPMAYMSGLMIIDCANYNEWQKRPRMEGTISCVTSFCNNLGQAIGAGVLGIMLGIAGYNGALEAQPTSAIVMIRLLMSIIPAVLYILVYLALNMYKLDKLKPQMEQEIQSARAAVKAAKEQSAGVFSSNESNQAII